MKLDAILAKCQELSSKRTQPDTLSQVVELVLKATVTSQTKKQRSTKQTVVNPDILIAFRVKYLTRHMWT